MKTLKARLKNLFAPDQLIADGGTLWKDRAGKWRRKRIAKFSGSGFVFLLTLFLTLASIGLPFPGKVSAARAEASSIYARDGTSLLYKIRGDKNRTAVPFDQMPKCMKDATVAVEDKDFYKHHGLDPRGFGRAFVTDLRSRTTAQGGSTITQQLVKNALLSPEQTVTRKAKELVLSLEIEQMFSKDDILRIYLNEIPYGSSAYGVEAASQTYFSKDAKDLTLSECATLASIPKAPTFYSPYNNADPNRLKNRSKFVLDQMAKQHLISEAQEVEAKTQVDKGVEFAAAKGEEIKAPHFVFYVREQLEQKYGAKTTQEGGLNVRTTLDPGKQEIAEDVIKTAARTRFAGYGASNAALTSIDPKTGEVLAMVGSVDYFDRAHDGNVNVATADRQPGSSFKPIVYTAAFKKGYDTNLHQAYNPATLLWDVKTDFGGGYAPNNYDQKFRGPVTARDALQQSLNVPSVKMLDLVGTGDALGLAHQMGITTLNDPGRYGDSLVLGGGEVKLVDLTSAYAVLANQGTAAYSTDNPNGTRTTVNAVLDVKNQKGKVLQKPRNGHPREVLGKDLAYQITDVLKDDQARAPQFGRGGPLTLPGREAAAKTGTTDSFRDAWTVGYTPTLTAGVWIGNNDNSPMNQVGGSIGAAPIWQDYMTRALQEDGDKGKVTSFERPSGIKEMQVDRLTGLLPDKGGQTKKEIFTDANAPRDKSPVATSSCDKNAKLSGLHSERPNSPNWEDPVQAFIKSHGITIPGGGNNQNSDQCGPDVSITSPTNGETVSGNITVSARATSDNGVKSVEFSWDGQGIGSASSAPFSTNYTIRDKSGKHTISAKATDNDGNSKTAQISVTVGGGEESTPTPTAATISLSCTGHACTANSTAPLTNPVLINADNPGQTVGMTKVANQTYAGTAPAGWTSVFAQGTDPDGNTVKSGNKTLAVAPFELAGLPENRLLG